VTVKEILLALTVLSYDDQEGYQHSSFLCSSREHKSD